ncbi:MAG: ATP-dependent Clp protease proteolytic subunit [Patescibacteria group bacterium]
MAQRILFFKDIDADTISDLIAQIESRESDDVEMLLDSCGGSVTPALSFHSYVRQSGIRLNISVIGWCYSAALMMFCAGSVRRASRTASFLLHPVRKLFEGTFTAEQLQKEVEELRRLDIIMREIFTDTVKRKRGEITSYFKQTTILDAVTAYRMGLLTEKPF